MELKEVETGVLIHIRVKPHARKFAVKLKDDRIIVELKSPPVEGKANEEAIRELSGLFGKPVRILKGHKSKHKTLLIQGTSAAEIRSLLNHIENSS
jgi:uncharacterized protein (TIGR00251 family)